MSNPKIAFLMSAPYSGATLFSILMNQHPEISSDGEIFPYTRGSEAICSCGSIQINCPYYKLIAENMINKEKNGYNEIFFYYVPKYFKNYYLSRVFEGFWENGLANRLRKFFCLIVPTIRRVEKEFIDLHLEFIANSLKERGASIYFDGSKSVRRAEFFIEREIDTKLIHLIRDGRAFCNSFLKNKELDYSYFPMAANAWKKHINKIDILSKRFPDIEILVVKYDDLCNAPDTQLKKVWDFLGLNYNKDFMLFKRNDMHILGNRMRNFYDGVIMKDESWRNQMMKDKVLRLNKLIKYELLRFGFTS